MPRGPLAAAALAAAALAARGARAQATTTLEAAFAIKGEDVKQYGEVYERADWTVHDPSRVVRITGPGGRVGLMMAATGKEQADGYDCGFETWVQWADADPPAWQPAQCVLPGNRRSKPAWIRKVVPTADGAYWAPSPTSDGRRIYYSVAPGNAMGDDPEGTSTAIGFVEAADGDGLSPPGLAYADAGAVVTWSPLGEENWDESEPTAIDPSVFEDGGRQWLVYGGQHIYVAELDPTTGFLASGYKARWSPRAGHHLLASGAKVDHEGEKLPKGERAWIEAPYLHKGADGMYYLFVNWFACCDGADSTYVIVVGRSASVTGPFVDRNGVDMTQGGGTLLLHGDETRRDEGCAGPGHPAVLVAEEGSGDDDVLTFHCYPVGGRPEFYVAARRLTWGQDGWPATQTFGVRAPGAVPLADAAAPDWRTTLKACSRSQCMNYKQKVEQAYYEQCSCNKRKRRCRRRCKREGTALARQIGLFACNKKKNRVARCNSAVRKIVELGGTV